MTTNNQTFDSFPGQAENLRWVQEGVVRSALVIVPQDWMRRREVLAAASLPGFRVIVMLGGNDGRAFAEDTGLHQLVQDTIVIYPDPITFDGNNVKFAGGHGGQAASVWPVDDAGMIASLLYHITNRLQARYNEHRTAMSPGGIQNNNAAFPRVVPSVTRVHDEDRIFAFGYSGGALMAYRLAADSPLVPVENPSATFPIRAIAVFAGTAGGHRQTETVGISSMLVANVPSTTCSILHIRGDDDDQVADEKFYTVGHPGAAFATKIQSTTVVTAAFPAGAAYPGTPCGNEYINRVSTMGYATALAHEMTRWDFTMDGSLQMWSDMLITPSAALPASVSANVTPLPYLPAAPAASAASFSWFQVNPGTEPRIHAIRVLGAGHAFPMSGGSTMGVPTSTAPWFGWNLAQYVVNFFAGF
jgi:poly(3-hydroxybutyrate) depolymerase